MRCLLCDLESSTSDEFCSSRCKELSCRIPRTSDSPLCRIELPDCGDVPFECWRDICSIGRSWFFSPTDRYGAATLHSSRRSTPGTTIDLSLDPSSLSIMRNVAPAASLHVSEWLALLDAHPLSSIGGIEELRDLLQMRGAPRARSSAGTLTVAACCEHACSPTLHFDHDDNLFRSTVMLEKGTQLTLSRLDAVDLLVDTTVRRDLLALTCGIQQCRCDRCAAPVDYSRRIRCTCGSFKYLEGSVWKCQCLDSWTSEEILSAHKEEALSKNVYTLRRSMASIHAGISALSKGTFKAVRDLTIDADELLGVGHWVCLLATESALVFFCVVSGRFDSVQLTAERIACKWVLYWLHCADSQRLFETVPLHIAKYLEGVGASLRCPSNRHFQRRLSLLTESIRHGQFSRNKCDLLASGCPVPSELFNEWEESLLAQVGNNEAARNTILAQLGSAPS